MRTFENLEARQHLSGIADVLTIQIYSGAAYSVGDYTGDGVDDLFVIGGDDSRWIVPLATAEQRETAAQRPLRCWRDSESCPMEDPGEWLQNVDDAFVDFNGDGAEDEIAFYDNNIQIHFGEPEQPNAGYDFADFLVLSKNFGRVGLEKTTPGGAAVGDLDLDGAVTFGDFLILSANYTG